MGSEVGSVECSGRSLTTEDTSHIFKGQLQGEESMRVLAVEDEPEYLEMLQIVMKTVGHSIIIARNGVEGLKVLDREKVDVVISDVNMPKMGGVEFHEKLRARPEFANTPFIFLTGQVNITEVKAVCKPDRDLLLQKPVPIDRLIEIFSGQVR